MSKRAEEDSCGSTLNDSTATIPIEDAAVQEVTFDLRHEKDSICSSDYGDESDEYDGEDKPKIPDGGYGWVVVFSSMMVSMIADGVSFSFGLLYIEFLDEFKSSKSTTAWIGSLFMAVPLLTGPIMSALVDRYGCRKMTILGGIISAVGFIISAFATSITVMFFTFGLLAGLGLGLCYVTVVVSIAYWFDKKRNFAVGLGACGTGVGTFVFAPLTQFLISEFGWRGATLLLAGTFLNMCVGGVLMKDPEWWIQEQNKQTSKRSSSIGSLSKRSALDDLPDIEEIRKLLENAKTDEYLLQNLVTSMETPNGLDRLCKEHHRSDFNLPTFIKQNEKVPLEVLEQLKANKKLYNVILENYPSLLACRSLSDKALNKESAQSAITRIPVTVSMKIKKAAKAPVIIASNKSPPIKSLVHQKSLPAETLHEPLLNRKSSLEDRAVAIQQRTEELPWLKKQFADNNYYKNIKLHRNSIMYRGAMLNIRKYRIRASSCPNIYRNSMITLAKEDEEKWYTEFIELLKGMADFSLFLELHFLLMSLSTILLFVWFIVPYFYLAEHMTRLGYTESEASYVISMIGISNTLAMIFLGWAGDQPWMNVTKTYSVCLIFCGISCGCMLYFTENYMALQISAAFFGLFFASSFSFTPVILVELIPLERFTTAYGLTLLCQGIGNLLGPPIAGLIFDLTGTWDQSFYQAGFWILVSGIFIAAIPMTKNRKIWGTGPVEKELATSERGSTA